MIIKLLTLPGKERKIEVKEFSNVGDLLMKDEMFRNRLICDLSRNLAHKEIIIGIRHHLSEEWFSYTLIEGCMVTLLEDDLIMYMMMYGD